MVKNVVHDRRQNDKQRNLQDTTIQLPNGHASRPSKLSSGFNLQWPPAGVAYGSSLSDKGHSLT